jgi:YaiO family outer membrane protein
MCPARRFRGDVRAPIRSASARATISRPPARSPEGAVRRGDESIDVRAARQAARLRARTRPLANALAALAISLCAAAMHGDDDVIARARAASAAGQRAAGLALLEAHLAETPRDVDARLAYALLLSWEARYDDARRELARVLDQAPGYLDAQIALMNVERWAGNDEPARAIAREVLSKQAHHPQALHVAQRIDAERQPFAVALAHTRDWFDDDREPWGETSLALGRETAHGAVLLRASHVARFGLRDQLIEVEAYPRFREGSYAYLGFGAGTQSALYPDWRLGLELYQSLPGSLEVSAGYRRLEFAEPVNIAVGSVSKYLGNWMLTARVYHVPVAGDGDSTSTFASVRRYFGDSGASFVGVRYGHGLAREELRDAADLVNVDSDSFALELDTELRHRLRLAVTTGFSRQERAAQSALWQIALGTTLGVRF